MRSDKLPNLVASIAVLIVSAALSIFHLCIDPRTRVLGGSASGGATGRSDTARSSVAGDPSA